MQNSSKNPLPPGLKPSEENPLLKATPHVRTPYIPQHEVPKTEKPSGIRMSGINPLAPKNVHKLPPGLKPSWENPLLKAEPHVRTPDIPQNQMLKSEESCSSCGNKAKFSCDCLSCFGDIIAEMDSEEGFLDVALDFSLLKKCRAQLQCFTDRKPALYELQPKK